MADVEDRLAMLANDTDTVAELLERAIPFDSPQINKPGSVPRPLARVVPVHAPSPERRTEPGTQRGNAKREKQVRRDGRPGQADAPYGVRGLRSLELGRSRRVCVIVSRLAVAWLRSRRKSERNSP